MKDTRGSPAIISLYTVYERPKDYPEGYVIRRFEIRPESPDPIPCEATYGATLDIVRERLPLGLVRLKRSIGDEPHIVEVWV